MNEILNAPVSYYRMEWQSDKHNVMTLWNTIDWLDVAGNRREYYMNDVPEVYTYGKTPGQRIYEPQPWHPVAKILQEHLQDMCGCKLESCVINGYANERDALGWHADDSPQMDNARPVVVASFGAERDIWFRRRDSVSQSKPGFSAALGHEALTLHDGSLLVMGPGMQLTHQHRIPKAGFKCGPRVSFTYRGWLQGKEQPAQR